MRTITRFRLAAIDLTDDSNERGIGLVVEVQDQKQQGKCPGGKKHYRLLEEPSSVLGRGRWKQAFLCCFYKSVALDNLLVFQSIYKVEDQSPKYSFWDFVKPQNFFFQATIMAAATKEVSPTKLSLFPVLSLDFLILNFVSPRVEKQNPSSHS